MKEEIVRSSETKNPFLDQLEDGFKRLQDPRSVKNIIKMEAGISQPPPSGSGEQY